MARCSPPFPQLHLALKIAGGAYLLYLAWKIAMSRSMGKGGDAKARPMSFRRGVAVPVGQPEGMGDGDHRDGALSRIRSRHSWSVLMVGVVFALTNFPSVSVWAAFGVGLRGFLADPVRLKWFNIAWACCLRQRFGRCCK